MNGDGRADVLTAPGRFAGVRVRLFSGVDDTLMADLALWQEGLQGEAQISA